MKNKSNSKNIDSSDLPTALKGDQVEAYLNKNNNSKLLVLKLDDLNAAIIQQLQERQCGMILLNENFKIVKQAKPDKIKHIQFSIDGHKRSVAIENIIRLEACGNYTYVYIKNETKPVLTSKTLKYYVNQFDDDDFLRPHQSHLVNRHFIHQVLLKPQPYLLLKDGVKICIARRRFSIFKDWED